MSRNNGKRRPFEILHRGMSHANPWSPLRLKGHEPSFIIVDDIDNEDEMSDREKAWMNSAIEFGKLYGIIKENKINTNMETLNVTKANALTAFERANEKGKQLLSDLFGKKVFIKDIRERIKTYEDACEHQGIKPLKLSDFDFLPEKDRGYHYYDHRQVIIKRALNEGWEPDPSNSDEPKYYVWYKWVGSVRGFSFGGFVCDPTSSLVGARHEFRSKELGEYYAKQFIGEVNECFIIK